MFLLLKKNSIVRNYDEFLDMSYEMLTDAMALCAQGSTKEEWDRKVDWIFPKKRKHDGEMLERYRKFKKGGRDGD